MEGKVDGDPLVFRWCGIGLLRNSRRLVRGAVTTDGGQEGIGRRGEKVEQIKVSLAGRELGICWERRYCSRSQFHDG